MLSDLIGDFGSLFRYLLVLLARATCRRARRVSGVAQRFVRGHFEGPGREERGSSKEESEYARFRAVNS